MATPIGHSLVAGALYLASRRSSPPDVWVLGYSAVLAVAPDLDVVPGLLVGHVGAFHHGISHSLGMAAVAATVGALAARRLARPLARHSLAYLWTVGFVAYLSHLALDLVTLDNTAPFGMPLLWPASGALVHAPFYIIPNVLHSGSELSLHNLGVVLRELALFGPVFAYLALSRWRAAPGAGRVGAVMAALYAVAALALFTRANPYF